MAGKVLPNGAPAKTARQRADMMLSRGAGVNNLAPVDDDQLRQGQGHFNDDDQGSAPAILAK